MENEKDNIEHEYHNRFYDYEESPPDLLWEAIQDRIKEKPKRRMIVWWQMGIAAGILLAILLPYLYFQTDEIAINTPKLKTEPLKKDTSEDVSTEENKDQDQKFVEKEIRKEKNKFEKNSETESNRNNNLSNNNPLKSELNNQNFSENSQKLSLEDDDWVVNKSNLDFNSTKLKRNIEAEKTEIVQLNEISATHESSNLLNFEKKDEINREVVINTRSSNVSDLQKNQFLSLNSLSSKNFIIQNFDKILLIPPYKSSDPIPTIELKEERRLAFIPPNEIFANVSPMLNYYIVSPNRTDNFKVKDFDGSGQRLSFAAQLGFTYQLTKRIDFRNALSYFTGKSNLKYEVVGNQNTNVKILNDQSIQFEKQTSAFHEQKRWQYFELQSDFVYKVRKNQSLSLGIRAGVETDKLRNPIFHNRAGYKLSKPISERIAFWLEPSFSVSLSNQNSLQNLFVYRTTGFGLNMGLSLMN